MQIFIDLTSTQIPMQVPYVPLTSAISSADWTVGYVYCSSLSWFKRHQPLLISSFLYVSILCPRIAYWVVSAPCLIYLLDLLQIALLMCLLNADVSVPVSSIWSNFSFIISIVFCFTVPEIPTHRKRCSIDCLCFWCFVFALSPRSCGGANAETLYRNLSRLRRRPRQSPVFK